MSKTPSVPGTDRPAEKAAGHWLLAQLGKKVLRPAAARPPTGCWLVLWAATLTSWSLRRAWVLPPWRL